MTQDFDVVVIGAGPSGMAVAADLFSQGFKVLVLDERPGPGGNIHASATYHSPASARSFGSDYMHGVARTKAFVASEIPAEYGASLSRVEGNTIHYMRAGRLHQIRARRLVLATGAVERPVPFPGWELPGVMTAGAFQLMMKQSRVLPAGEYVLCGSSPLLLLLACQLLRQGSRPKAILDTSPAASVFRAGLDHLIALAHNPWSAAKGLGYMARLRLAGVSIIRDVTALSAHGADTVDEIAYTRRDGRTGSLPVRTVLVHEGVIPNIQVSLSLGCAHRWDDVQMCFVPQLDAWGESTRPGTFIIGDAGGILGAEAALHAARLAATRIAEQIGVARDPRADADRSADVSAARRGLSRARRLRAFLDAAFPPGLSSKPPADDTVICRCEQVRASTLRAAVRDGAMGPSQAKVFTRCGMGLCQGRICGNAVTRLIAAETGQSPQDVGSYHVRFPLKPLSLAELAEEDTCEGQADAPAA
ncbi:FAD-dependent oxidoreductase [Paracoccus pantotrophus]|uniref:NAD(P)/FAD-dependent oxidoreductase n=1 Tax=Paracoccus pantotrophus TaxID=82367 RepID=UPI000E090A5C|nr:NAD(P)/FAD-dependent oxidoreductase [Paracoccus pantotrophus]RDD95287.1 FAD-dependent oxidoreductase [Paracoccus pantotrophus]WGR64179.1 FAD-dependent oxidoreductase [Paracoccus pantotrophus]